MNPTNPLDRFPLLSEDTRWLLGELSGAMDGHGAREICASRRGLTLKHNGLTVCGGRNCHELRLAYQAARSATKISP